jgi:hypothetical protein
MVELTVIKIYLECTIWKYSMNMLVRFDIGSLLSTL